MEVVARSPAERLKATCFLGVDACSTEDFTHLYLRGKIVNPDGGVSAKLVSEFCISFVAAGKFQTNSLAERIRGRRL